jgi:hypothetical protein
MSIDEWDSSDFMDDDVPPVPLPTPEELQRRKECSELWRIFCEVNWAIMCLKAVREIEQTCSELNEGFFVVAYRSLNDDALTCLMRVMDDHPATFSFWNLENRYPARIAIICRKAKIDLLAVKHLDQRLRKARNETHFHINKRHAANSEPFWANLAITHDEMIQTAKDIAGIIGAILCEDYNFPANLSRYDATDVRPILEHLHEHGLGNFRMR